MSGTVAADKCQPSNKAQYEAERRCSTLGTDSIMPILRKQIKLQDVL